MSTSETPRNLPPNGLGPSEIPGHLGRLGSYEILEVIGRGASGVVYKALDPTLHGAVAVKALAPQLATQDAARAGFLRDATARVEGEGLGEVLSVEEANGLPYVVAEYVPGPSLQDKLDRGNRPQETAEVLRVGAQLARALARLHGLGVVHRGVKPSNVLIDEATGQVKLAVTGHLGAADGNALVKAGYAGDAPGYMSPEQADGAAQDHRTDLFSLGCVLYRMAAGRPAFRGPTPQATLESVRHDAPRRLGEVNPQAPDWLEAILTRLLAKNPAGRYGSAAEVANLLDQCLAHVQNGAPLPAVSPPPVTAPPSPPAISPERSDEVPTAASPSSPPAPRPRPAPDRPRRHLPRDLRQPQSSALRWVLIALGIAIFPLCGLGVLGLGWYLASAGPRFAAKPRIVQPGFQQQQFQAFPQQAVPSPQTIEAMNWFPADATVAGMFDLRKFEPLAPKSEAGKVLAALLPADFKELVTADEVRDARLDRVALVYAADPKKPDQGRYVVRLTGVFKSDPVAAVLQRKLPDLEVAKVPLPAGVPNDPSVKILTGPKAPLAVALVRDTDVLLAWQEGAAPDENRHLPILLDALAVRAQRKIHVLNQKAALYVPLKDVPANACGFVIGEIPAAWRKEMVARWKLSFAPHRTDLHLLGNRDQFTIGMDLSPEKLEHGAELGNTMERFRQEGVDALNQLPEAIKLRPVANAALIQALHSMRLTDRGANPPPLWQGLPRNDPARSAPVRNWTQTLNGAELDALWDVVKQATALKKE